MDNKLSNIFLHFLNKDTQEIFGIANTQNFTILENLRRGLNASILLCQDYCFMPLGFYFECQNTRNIILQSLEFVKEGLLRFCIRESELNEYVEKKQGQLKRFANDISYQSFYDTEFTKQLNLISPIFLQRNIKVGDYCVDRWIEQHKLFHDSKIGDMYKVYCQINDVHDIIKISSKIQNAALDAKEGAFVWTVIKNTYDRLYIKDKKLYQNLRMYFEKYYYEAYLIEYHASLLYDFYLIDRGYDFDLKSEHKALTNFSWFYTFLKCLNIEECLNMTAEKVVALKYMPHYIKLLDIYINICNRKTFKNNIRSLNSIVADMLIKNEKNINDLTRTIKEIIEQKKLMGGIEFMGMKKNKSDTDVLILIATEEEERAILENDSWEKMKTQEGYTYFRKIEGMSFALARAIDMRENETSIVGQYFFDILKPRYISMVGFCAGQKGKTVLGDVIVPHKIYRYGMGKRESEDQTTPEMDGYKINPIWKQKVERFGDNWRKKSDISKPVDYNYQKYIFIKALSESEMEIVPSDLWKFEEVPDLPQIIEEFEEKDYISMVNGKIGLTKLGKNKVKNEMLIEYWGGYIESKPTTRAGVLATGDDVQQWSGIFDELSKQYDRKTIAIDMEAHAIGSISSFNNRPFIIAKGVGDYARDNKAFDNRYIGYACHMSCRFIIEFFNSLEDEELLQ